MRIKAQPSPALAAMYEADIAAGRNPLELTPVIEVEVAPPPGAPRELVIEPVDWHEEERKWLQQEREERAARDAARIAEQVAKLEPADPPEKPTPPAAKRKPWRR